VQSWSCCQEFRAVRHSGGCRHGTIAGAGVLSEQQGAHAAPRAQGQLHVCPTSKHVCCTLSARHATAAGSRLAPCSHAPTRLRRHSTASACAHAAPVYPRVWCACAAGQSMAHRCAAHYNYSRTVTWPGRHRLASLHGPRLPAGKRCAAGLQVQRPPATSTIHSVWSVNSLTTPVKAPESAALSGGPGT
jgi:hypothetical protein